MKEDRTIITFGVDDSEQAKAPATKKTKKTTAAKVAETEETSETKVANIKETPVEKIAEIESTTDTKSAEIEKTAVEVVDSNESATTSEAVHSNESESTPEINEATVTLSSSDTVADSTTSSATVESSSASYSDKQSDSSKAVPHYVTRKFLIICLIVVMVVSTVLGASIAVLVSGGSSSSKHDQSLSESDLGKATGSELTIAEINDMNEDAVVEIVTSATTQGLFGQMQISEGAGSGVIVKENGYIVTNYHVIEDATQVQVTLHEGTSYNATIVGGDYDNDIAVLKISANNLTTVTMGDSDELDVGDLAVAIGNPLGQLGGTCTQGIISSLNRKLTVDDRTLDLLQTDAAINPGNSGGGLFNSKGELVGIVESKSSGTGIEGLGFAIPINTVKDEIDDLIKNGKVTTKPSIGITIYEVSEDVAQANGLNGSGVYISEVTGTNAKKAGFQEGDKLISIDGEDFEGSSDFIQQVRKHKVGDTITVTIERNGKQLKIKTVLESLDVTE